MPRISYVNGRYVRHADAAVHIEDRGYQFADGVYEVIAVHGGRMIDEVGHMQRLGRSLGELGIAWPMATGPMKVVMGEMLRRNHIGYGMLYIQVTRGVAARGHAFPDPSTASSLVMTTRSLPAPEMETLGRGVGVITIPDIRWQRRDIKTIGLLPNCLGKQQAMESGAFEAWMVDGDGLVTEGTLSNAWIVTKSGELVTRHADQAILDGVTRRAVLKLAGNRGIVFHERPFSVKEAKDAREAFVTGTTALIKPVVRIDGQDIGDGHPGKLSLDLLGLYLDHVSDLCGEA